MTSAEVRSGLLLLALTLPWPSPVGAQPAATAPVGQAEAQRAEKATSKATVEVFGNAEYSDASWGAYLGDRESGSGFGGNVGVRVYPSPNTRCGIGFRFSRFGFNGTQRRFLSGDAPFDGSAWSAFADLFVHSQTQRAQVFFFVGVGFGQATHTVHYPYGRAEQHDRPGSFFGTDIGVGLKVPVTKRLALGPEFRTVLAPRHDQWFSMSIGVGMTYTIQK